MVITPRDKREQEEMIRNFKIAFQKRHGIIPEVTIQEQEVLDVSESLLNLRIIVNRQIPVDLRDTIWCISTKIRLRKMVNLRMVFSMIGKDYDYPLKEIASYCGLEGDHSTVLYYISAGYDLLETNSEFRELYIKIASQVNPQVYPHARISTTIIEESPISKSAGSSPLYQRKYTVYRPDTGSINRARTMQAARLAG